MPGSPRRRSSSNTSSGGTSTGTAGGLRQASLRSQDAFAELAAAATADASGRMPSSRRHTSSSSQEAPDYHSPLRASSTSSWAEFAEAPPPYAGNPFQQPLSPQQQQQKQQQAGPLARQVTAGARTSSWGEFLQGPGSGGSGVLASQLSSLNLG